MTQLLDVRVTFTTPSGERCTALLGDVPHDAVATSLRSLRARVEFERRAERLRRLRRLRAAHERSRWQS